MHSSELTWVELNVPASEISTNWLLLLLLLPHTSSFFCYFDFALSLALLALLCLTLFCFRTFFDFSDVCFDLLWKFGFHYKQRQGKWICMCERERVCSCERACCWPTSRHKSGAYKHLMGFPHLTHTHTHATYTDSRAECQHSKLLSSLSIKALCQLSLL